MNRAFAESPDNVFRHIAAGKRHPCVHCATDANGFMTVTFVHVFRLNSDGQCTRCKGILPFTFWQYQEKPLAEYLPS